MGHRYGRKVAKQRAIQESLSAMAPCIEENILDGSAESYAEEAVEIEMEYTAYTEANRIYLQLKMRGETPYSWWRQQQRTDFNRRIYVELCDFWEAELDAGLDDGTDWPEDTADGHPWKLYADLEKEWKRLGGS